jgi:hypothetical protein
MDLKRLTNRAKELVEKRGGTDSLKEDAGELRDIAKGKGSLGDKAKAAQEAISKPGAEQPAKAEQPARSEQPAKAERASGDRPTSPGDA